MVIIQRDICRTEADVSMRLLHWIGSEGIQHHDCDLARHHLSTAPERSVRIHVLCVYFLFLLDLRVGSRFH